MPDLIHFLERAGQRVGFLEEESLGILHSREPRRLSSPNSWQPANISHHKIPSFTAGHSSVFLLFRSTPTVKPFFSCD